MIYLWYALLNEKHGNTLVLNPPANLHIFQYILIIIFKLIDANNFLAVCLNKHIVI